MARPTAPGESTRSRGFTYILLLWWVAISGVLLAALGQQWLIESRRQKETELVFRGKQIGRALGSYRDATPNGQSPSPRSLAELLEDKRGPKVLRHLRQAFPDPITGKPWVMDLDQGRIVAVHSASKAKPIRPPDGVETYEQWRFDASARTPIIPASGVESAAPSSLQASAPTPAVLDLSPSASMDPAAASSPVYVPRPVRSRAK